MEGLIREQKALSEDLKVLSHMWRWRATGPDSMSLAFDILRKGVKWGIEWESHDISMTFMTSETN